MFKIIITCEVISCNNMYLSINCEGPETHPNLIPGQINFDKLSILITRESTSIERNDLQKSKNK